MAMTSEDSIAQRTIPGRVVPLASKASEWLALGRALLAEMQKLYGIAPGTHTIAVGWTTVEGLGARRFVGGSRTVRETAALPHPAPHIAAPRVNNQFVDHAEQDVANAFIDAVADAGLLDSTLDGENLRIFVSHADGPCSACVQGLGDRQVDPGVLAQLSQRFPGLVVTLAWEQADGRLGHAILQDGKRLF